MTFGKIFNGPFGFRKAVSLSLVDDRNGSAIRAVSVTGQGNFETRLTARVIRGGEFKQRHEMIDGKLLAVVDDCNRPVMDYVEGTGQILDVKDYFGTRAETKAKSFAASGNKFKARLYANARFGRLHDYIQHLYVTGVYNDKKELNLGSGLITNVSQQALANDFNWPNPTTAINTLKICNFHATGTGATAAAATDIALQTADAVTPVAGAQSFVSAANLQKLQTVATLSYGGTEAVTEWGLFSSSTLSATTGSPATASSATSITATGTPYTASTSSVQGQTQKIVVDTTASPNVYGLITSNTTSVISIPAWYKATDGTAGTTPGATDAFAIKPVILDHKVFSAINVSSGDSIQFTYLLTCATGG